MVKEDVEKTDRFLIASAKKCPRLVRTSHEAQQGPKGAVQCGAWLGAQEEQKNTEAYKHQCLCFKWLPYMLSLLGHGISILLIVLPLISPAQPFGSGETTGHWLRNGHVI